MKQIITSLLAFFLGGFLCIYFTGIELTREIKELRKENDSLQQAFTTLQDLNDSLEVEITLKDTSISLLVREGVRLDSLYNKNKKDISKLKREYEKTNRVDNYSSPDIIRYFTDSL